MTTRRRKKNRLFVDEIDTVGLVDKGDDPEARIVFLKRAETEGEMKKREQGERLKLDAAVAQLQDLVSAWMHERQGRPGPVSRDVGTVRILQANPGLFEEISRLAATDALHKAKAVRPGVEERAGVDGTVSMLSKGLAPGDPRLGMQLVQRHFPALHRRWQGLEK